jgi:hypothetical protein
MEAEAKEGLPSEAAHAAEGGLKLFQEYGNEQGNVS